MWPRALVADTAAATAVAAAAAAAGVLLFVQLLPVAVACFEYQRFMEQVSCWRYTSSSQAV
jgi:hypothetical protein